AQQTHAVEFATDHAGGDEDGRVDGLLGVELARGDRLFQAPQVHFGEVLAVEAVEAALGHAHVQRHLAAFEAGDGDAGARLLALHAATGGLALARARATAHAHTALGGAFT